MDRFEQVTIMKKANSYFDGKVTSRTVLFPNGERKTLGIMMPGEYEFGTGLKEVMEILEGKIEVKLPGQEQYKLYAAGDSFEVPGNSTFQLVVKELTDYCCSYIPA